MNNGNTYNVAFYLRLSKDDGDNSESQSITNQREFLESFLKNAEDNLVFIKEYVDDGYSGSNFDRPAWRELLEDIQNKKINTIITKDLSRLGRDYLSVGNYIERDFPEKNVRYIAINDDIDTEYETVGLDFLQFKLVFNDFYLKDTSKKIRKVLANKKESGLFLGWKAPYGYIKNPDDKYKLIVDENVRDIVVRIFDMVILGHGLRYIRNVLSEEGILNPSEYANISRGVVATSHKLWCTRTIEEMITNETYIGNLTQGRRKKVNYKSKKEVRTPKEDWIIVKNTHEGIITQEKFDMAGAILKKNKNIQVSKNNLLLQGFLYCKECGHKISINKSIGGVRKYTCCSYYLSHSKFNLCTPHSNNYDKLEALVLDEIRGLCQKYVDKSEFSNKINEVLDVNSKKIEYTKNIAKFRNVVVSNQNLIDKIYEDKLNGNISLEMYNRNIIKFNDKINTALSEIDILSDKLSNYNEEKALLKAQKQLASILEYMNLEKPDKAFLANIIDKIYIHKDKTIEICYKFSI